jgi:energy-coupling factor transporter transmembrane protein EcfT
MNARNWSSTGARWRLGTLGHTSCLAFALVLAVSATGTRLLLAVLLTGLLALAFQRGGLRSLASLRVWAILALMVIPATLVIGRADVRVWGVALSHEGIAEGAQMALRALAIVVAVTGFAASVSVNEAGALLERAGLKGLGFAFGVAVNMLPTLADTTANAYHAMRLRGGLRRWRLRPVRLLLVTMVANSLRHADDIVNAAEARAFAADRRRPLPPLWRPLDLALAAALLVTGILVLVA